MPFLKPAAFREEEVGTEARKFAFNAAAVFALLAGVLFQCESAIIMITITITATIIISAPPEPCRGISRGFFSRAGYSL